MNPTTAGSNALPLWTVHVALAFVQVAYGGYHVVSKVALTAGVNSLVFCLWRDAIALSFLGVAALVSERNRRGARVLMTGWLGFLLFLLGCTGVFGNQYLFLQGLKRTTPLAAAALQPAQPVFTFLLAALFRLEAVRWTRRDGVAKWGGVCVCVFGALVITSFQGPRVIGGEGGGGGGSEEFSMKSIYSFGMASLNSEGEWDTEWQLGILCLIGNCLSMSVYLIIQVRVLVLYPSPVAVTAFSYWWGTCLIALLAALLVSDYSLFLLTPTELAAAIYAGVIASALNYALVSWANGRVGPAMVALYSPLQPFAGALLSTLFLGSPVHLGTGGDCTSSNTMATSGESIWFC